MKIIFILVLSLMSFGAVSSVFNNTSTASTQSSNYQQQPTRVNTKRVVPKQGITDNSNLNKDKIIKNMSTTNAIKTAFPLTPSEISLIKKIMSKNQKALSTIDQPTEFRNRSVVVGTDPGMESTEIVISPGYITSLIMLDKSGKPWPISKIALGSAAKFQFTKATDNVVTISPIDNFSSSNALLFLENLPTPIILTIKTSQSIVDFKVEARVNLNNISEQQKSSLSGFANSTNSIGTLLNNMSVSSDKIASLMLDGTPPKNFKRLNNNAQFVLESWLDDDVIYLRTDKKLLSPSFLSKLTSSNGTNLYKVPYMANLLFIDNGRVSSVQLTR